jgi:Dynamin family
MSLGSTWLRWFSDDGSAKVEPVYQTARDCLDAMPPDVPVALGARLERAIAVLVRDEIFIAIAGLFKVGKSTLINRVADWEILPSGDLPETGAPAFLRRRKPRAVTVHHRDGGSRTISPDAQSISVETSLYESDGSRRSLDRLAKCVEIDAPRLRCGSRVVLIDLPGLRDTSEMDDVALETALESDLLLWIFRSEPAFSEQDVEFLSLLASAAGSHTIQLALNVISGESDRWAEFLTTRLAGHRAGITRYLDSMGLGSHHLDGLIVFDARRIRYRRFGNFFGETFGGSQLFRVLKTLSNSDDEKVRLGRLTRVKSAIDEYRSWLGPTIEEAARVYREQQTKCSAYQQRLARRKKLESELSRNVNAAFDGLESEMGKVGDSAALRVSAFGYTAFESVGEPLSAGARTAVVTRARALVASIATLTANEEAVPMDPSANDAIVRAFAFGDGVRVMCGEEAIQKGITGEVGYIYTPKPKMSLGRVFSWLKGQDTGVDDAVAEIRAELRSKALAIAVRTRGQRTSVQVAAAKAFQLVPIGPSPPEPDGKRLALLQKAMKRAEIAREGLVSAMSPSQ